MTPLERELEAALRAGSAQATTLALCRAWAMVPSTRLAKLARAFGAQLHRASVPGANEAQREAAWHELAERATAEDLETLLATPWSKKPKHAVERLAAFKTLGPDPRIVGHLLDLDTGARFPNSAGRLFWVEAYLLMLDWGSVEASERISKDPHKHRTPGETARYRAIDMLVSLRREGRWPTEPVLEPACVSLLEQLEHRLAPATKLRDGLLSAVYAAPDDDGPRLVLADALTEQGDPRGEFIALQLAHARGELTMAKREEMQRLLSASGRAWYDGLDRQLQPMAVFQRGFLSEVSLETRTLDPSNPAWATVEHLRTGGLALALSEFLGHPHLRNVKALGGLLGESLAELARLGGERTWSLLEVTRLGPRDLAPPKWRVGTLRLAAMPDQATWWLGGGALRGKVETLSLPVRVEFDRVGALVTQLEAVDEGITTLELAAQPSWWPAVWHGDWLMRFERDARGRFGALALSLGDETLGGLEEALTRFEPDQLTALRVTVLLGRGPQWRESVRAMLERALKAQKRLKTIEIAIDKPTRLPPKPTVSTGT